MIFWLYNNLITGGITAFCSVKLLDYFYLWVKIFQYNGIAIFLEAKLIINRLVFCHWVISEINTDFEEILNKFSMFF